MAATRFLPGLSPGVWKTNNRSKDPPLFKKLDFNLKITGLKEKSKSDANFSAKWQRHSRNNLLILPSEDW